MILNMVRGLDWIGQVILFCTWRNFELLYTQHSLLTDILFIESV